MQTHVKKNCAGCFRILSDGTRLKLIKILKEKCVEANVTHLTENLGVTQPTVSYHLQALHALGLVAKKRKGRETFYFFNKNYPCRGCGVFSASIK